MSVTVKICQRCGTEISDQPTVNATGDTYCAKCVRGLQFIQQVRTGDPELPIVFIFAAIINCLVPVYWSIVTIGQVFSSQYDLACFNAVIALAAARGTVGFFRHRLWSYHWLIILSALGLVLDGISLATYFIREGGAPQFFGCGLYGISIVFNAVALVLMLACQHNSDLPPTRESMPKQDKSWLLIASLAAVAVVAVGGACWWIVRASNVTMAQRQEMNALLDTADADFATGRYDDASTAYSKAIGIADRNHFGDDSIGIQNARTNKATADTKVATRKAAEAEVTRREAQTKAAAEAAEQRKAQAVQAKETEAETIRLKAQWVRSQRNGHIWTGSDKDLAHFYDNLVRATGEDPVGRGVAKMEAEDPQPTVPQGGDQPNVQAVISPKDCSDPLRAYQAGMYLLSGTGGPVDGERAVEWLQRAVDLGHAPAATQLGHLYREGRHVEQNHSTSTQWFRKGAEAGDAGAMMMYGLCCATGEGIRQDWSEAKRWYRAAADKGITEAMHNLAVMYLQGNGMPVDEEEGRKLLRRSAEAGSSMSMKVLGQVAEKHQRGAVSRRPEDRERALQLCQEGARYGYANSEVRQDRDRAVRAFKEAASLGNAQAMWSLGSIYAEDNTVAQAYPRVQVQPRRPQAARNPVPSPQPNLSDAIRWYRAAINAGNSKAMIDLGVMLENGTGIAKNETEAANLYRKAAEQGHPVGMFNLAGAYERGMGVQRDDSQAFHWFKEAALHGDTDAMIRLAKTHADGKAVPLTDAEAEKWVRCAAELGNSDAQRLINNSN